MDESLDFADAPEPLPCCETGQALFQECCEMPLGNKQMDDQQSTMIDKPSDSDSFDQPFQTDDAQSEAVQATGEDQDIDWQDWQTCPDADPTPQWLPLTPTDTAAE